MSDSLLTPWTVAHQAPLSMGFFRQENRSRSLLPSPGDHPAPGFEPRVPVLQAEQCALLKFLFSLEFHP